MWEESRARFSRKTAGGRRLHGFGAKRFARRRLFRGWLEQGFHVGHQVFRNSEDGGAVGRTGIVIRVFLRADLQPSLASLPIQAQQRGRFVQTIFSGILTLDVGKSIHTSFLECVEETLDLSLV